MTAAYDLIIVGGGNAGLAAAAAAGERGIRTLVLEKTDELGGQLHWSSGHFSAAGTRRQLERGIEDDADLHFADVIALGHGLANERLVRRAVDQAASAVDWLEDAGFPFAADAPAFITGHELYSRPRTYWGGTDLTRGGIPIMETLIAAVAGHESVTVQTGVSVGDLITGLTESGPVVSGVVTDDATRIGARHVVLATGGYGASRDLVARMQPDQAGALTGCRDHATGDGHSMLMELGVPVTHADTYVPTMGMIEDPKRPGFGLRLTDARVIVDAVQRPPWEIWVNSDGRRFVAEDSASPFAREEALRRQAGLAMWVIWDRGVMEAAPPMIGPDWTTGRVLAEAAGGTWLRRYEDLRSLAIDQGLPPETLAATVVEYNTHQTDPLGRIHRPVHIERPPFYAVRVVGGMLLSRGGPTIDDELRPVDGSGRPIESLYAVGELLGMGQFSGDSFAGGMSVGPALSLGRWVVGRIDARLRPG